MSLLDQRPMILDRVAAGAADPHCLGRRDPVMLALQSPQEELQPGVPIRCAVRILACVRRGGLAADLS
jgi:hypothetical protein